MWAFFKGAKRSELGERFDVHATLSNPSFQPLCGTILQAGTFKLVNGRLVFIGKSSGSVVSFPELGQSNSLLLGKIVANILCVNRHATSPLLNATQSWPWLARNQALSPDPSYFDRGSPVPKYDKRRVQALRACS